MTEGAKDASEYGSVHRQEIIDLPFRHDFFYLSGPPNYLIACNPSALVENDEQVARPDVFHLEKVADFLRVVTAILHSSEHRVVRH